MPTLDPTLFASLDDEQFPQSLRALIVAAPLPSLGSGPRDAALVQALQSRAECLQQISPAGLAGLWLLAGDLDASHSISQSIDDSDGSFWHAIMHRREGDFSNAKYWLRRVGRHGVLAELATTPYGDPLRFVDACERATGRLKDASHSATDSLIQLQWLEWQHLFAHCLRQASV